MKLKLIRTHLGATATMGELFVDGKFECYTLEDKVRTLNFADDKVYGKTAIPAGQYNVVINLSNRFKRMLPLLQSVPFFDGIRIHPGNTSQDTDGCILVGTTKSGEDFIGNSRVAFDKLFAKMESTKDISIEIT